MLGFAGNDILEPDHKALFAKVPLSHGGNHRLSVGIEAGFSIAFLGMLNVAKRRVVVLALAGIDDPHAESTVHSG